MTAHATRQAMPIVGLDDSVVGSTTTAPLVVDSRPFVVDPIGSPPPRRDAIGDLYAAAKLMGLLDALAEMPGYVMATVFAADMPDAGTAARLWAGARGLNVIDRTNSYPGDTSRPVPYTVRIMEVSIGLHRGHLTIQWPPVAIVAEVTP